MTRFNHAAYGLNYGMVIDFMSNDVGGLLIITFIGNNLRDDPARFYLIFAFHIRVNCSPSEQDILELGKETFKISNLDKDNIKILC